MVKSMNEITESLGFRMDRIKLKETETQTISSSLENYIRDLTVLFDIEFKELSRITVREFYEKFMTKLNTIEISIQNTEYNIKDHMERIEDYLKNAEDAGISKEKDPYYKAFVESRLIIAKLVASITHRVLITKASINVAGKFLKMLDEVKKLDVEKMKVDADKSLFEKLYEEIKKIMKDQEERHLKAMESLELQLKAEREHTKELMRMIKDIKKDVLNVDEEVVRKLEENKAFREIQKQREPAPIVIARETIRESLPDYKPDIPNIPSGTEKMINLGTHKVRLADIEDANKMHSIYDKIKYIFERYPSLTDIEMHHLFSVVKANIRFGEIVNALRDVKNANSAIPIAEE